MIITIALVASSASSGSSKVPAMLLTLICPDDGISDAIAQISEDRFPHNLDPVETNEKIRAKLIELSKSGGLEPVVVTQNFGDGPVQKTVKVFDFDNPQNNDFLVTNQFQLEGFKNPIFHTSNCSCRPWIFI